MRRSPRILVLSRSYPSQVFPSLGLWVERPTTMLGERLDVRVVAPVPYWPPLPDIAPLRQYARFRKIPQHETRSRIEVDRPRYLSGPGRSTYRFEASAYYAGMRSTIDRIRESFPFDLIHAHMVYPEGAAAHRLSDRYGTPFVITEHAPWVPRWFANTRIREQATAAGRAAGAITAVSNYVRDSILDYVDDQSAVSVVPTGVDGELFTSRLRAERRRDQIIFVGWPNLNKGVDVLLHAMRQIADAGAPGRLLIVGGSYYRDTRIQEHALHALARSLALGDRVTFLGSRSQAEVAELMSESAVLVLPSRAEASGTVLVEAMAAGTPVVATRCGGPEDYVTPEVGKLVPTEDSTALAAALSEMLREQDRYDPSELRRYALERFSWERVVEGFAEAYDRALQRGGGSGSNGGTLAAARLDGGAA